MIGIILTGHGKFASGLYSAIQLIAGSKDHFFCCDFIEGMGADEDLVPQIQQAIDTLSSECASILIFSDLKGGSPFQKAVTVIQQMPNAVVLAGTNLPMLLEAVFMREAIDDVHELADKLVITGQEQIYKYVFEAKKVRTEETGGI